MPLLNYFSRYTVESNLSKLSLFLFISEKKSYDNRRYRALAKNFTYESEFMIY